MSYTGTVDLGKGWKHYVNGMSVTATAMRVFLKRQLERQKALINECEATGADAHQLQIEHGQLNKELVVVEQVLRQKMTNKPAPKRARTKETKMSKKQAVPAAEQKAVPAEKQKNTARAGKYCYVKGNKETFVIQHEMGNWVYAQSTTTQKVHRIRKDLALSERPSEEKAS